MGYFFAQTNSSLFSSSSQCNSAVTALRLAGINYGCFMGCSIKPDTCPFCSGLKMEEEYSYMTLQQPFFWKIVSNRIFGSSSEAQAYCDSAAGIVPMTVCNAGSVIQTNNSTRICCNPFPYQST